MEACVERRLEYGNDAAVGEVLASRLQCQSDGMGMVGVIVDKGHVAVFQPTLYTRLHRFLQPFSEAFDLADDVVIVEIQPSREVDTGLVHGDDLVRKIATRLTFEGKTDAVRYGGTFEETAALLRALRRPGDVIVVMGSGPVNQVIAGARLNAHP